jgi:hypothetical protein
VQTDLIIGFSCLEHFVSPSLIIETAFEGMWAKTFLQPLQSPRAMTQIVL